MTILNSTKHTDPRALYRIAKLPIEIQEHVKINDPSWSYVPTGWIDLVVQLHNELIQIEPNYVLNQVKEKFGGLCYYTEQMHILAHSEFHAAVRRAEDKSFTVCDMCGGAGSLGNVTKSFIATRCETHRNQTNPPLVIK
jgi:hypothetical protein